MSSAVHDPSMWCPSCGICHCRKHFEDRMSLVRIGDGHHESALADDKDQAQNTTVVAERGAQ